MSDLLVTSATPTLRTGQGVRTYGVAAALARHGPVELAYVTFGAERHGAEYDALEHVRLRALRASRGVRRSAQFARARLRGVPSYFARGVSPELMHAADLQRGMRVIADGPVAAAALLPLAQTRDVVYLAHNLESGFREHWGRGDLERFERDVLNAFSECWMATRADARGAMALVGHELNARYVPNVVDVNRIEPVRPDGRERILFIGDFTYAPNVEGLKFLVEQVLPIAWERRPHLRVSVVGRGLVDAPADERVDALGFVENLRSAYAAADIVVVPLLRGGGSPIKFIEALAYGLPVVATEHAARLLEEAVAGEHFIAVRDPAQFAEELDRLLADAARRAAVGAAGRELVERCYSVETLATLLRR